MIRRGRISPTSWAGPETGVRPQQQREASGAGHRAGGRLRASRTRKGSSEYGQYSIHQPMVGQAKTLLKRDPAGVKRRGRSGSSGARVLARKIGRDGFRSSSRDEADQSAHLRRRDALRRQAHQPVRAVEEIIRTGKAASPTRFGKMVKLQEARKPVVSRVRRSSANGPHDSIC